MHHDKSSTYDHVAFSNSTKTRGHNSIEEDNTTHLNRPSLHPPKSHRPSSSKTQTSRPNQTPNSENKTSASRRRFPKMAALQQSPVAFQAKSPPSARLNPTTLSPRAVRLSFSATFPSLKLSGKISSKPKRRGGSAAGATMVDSAAESYASALAEVAESNKTLDQTNEDVEKLVQVFSDPKVYNFFVNPTIEDDQKYKLVEDISKSSSLQPHTTNFLNILVDSKRIEIFSEIAKEFEVVYNKLTETELAVVTSVVKLESQHLAQIAKGVQRLTGAKNVRIKTAIDPSLVAGFTIRYGSSGSKLIDMSVKKQLAEIATQLDFSDLSLAV